VIYNARFAPDAETIVYGASWNGQPIRVFSTRIGSAESRDLGLPPADLLAVSRSGELAVCLGKKSIFSSCTLARVPLAGGAPREISSDVYQADWAPDGQDLAIIRRLPDRNVIEYPIGKVLYTSPHSLYSVRFSPRGDALAFTEEEANYHCDIALLDLTGKKRVLTTAFFSRYLAWRAAGDEIWFDNADRGGFATSIYAVNLSGRQRMIRREAMLLSTMDIAKDGRALVVSVTLSSSMAAVLSGESAERNVSWLDYSVVDDVSHDGRTILFDEWGEGGGRSAAYYLWRLNEPAAIRLGEGLGHALSPDGNAVLTSPPSQDELILQPTGTGQPRSLGKNKLDVNSAAFLPDGTAVVFSGRAPGGGWRLYRQELAGNQPPKAFSDEGLSGERLAVSPDGRFVAARRKDRKVCLYPLSGEPARCFDSAPAEEPLQWSADARALFLYTMTDLPGRIVRLDLESGQRQLWKNFGPSDLAGIQRFERAALAPGGTSFVYSTERVFCTLFVIGGLQ
jgi:Tol biopolymer transport system component